MLERQHGWQNISKRIHFLTLVLKTRQHVLFLLVSTRQLQIGPVLDPKVCGHGQKQLMYVCFLKLRETTPQKKAAYSDFF